MSAAEPHLLPDVEPEFTAARPDLLALEGIQLHRIMLKVIIGFGAFYCILNFLLDNDVFFYINFSVLPLFFLSYWIDAKISTYAAKVWTLSIINLQISAVASAAGSETYNFLFFIPILIGSLIIFQGKERVTGYVFTAISSVLLFVISFSEIRFGQVMFTGQQLKIEQASNLVGVCTAILLQIRFIILVSRDIQKKMFRNALALETSNRRLSTSLYTRDKMMSVLTHDLRSPVVTIQSGLQLMQSGQLHPSFQEKTMGQMAQKSKAVVQLIDKILLWSRAQTEQIQYQESLVSGDQLRQMIQTTCELLQSEKLIHFVVNIKVSSTTQVPCDMNMVEAILRNLISNAIKFSTPGSEITITVSENKNSVLFEVIDQGKGMSETEVEMLRKRISFSKLGTEKEMGHGLGMSLVIDFLEQHGTVLKIQSKENQGSTFSFTLRTQTAR